MTVLRVLGHCFDSSGPVAFCHPTADRCGERAACLLGVLYVECFEIDVRGESCLELLRSGLLVFTDIFPASSSQTTLTHSTSSPLRVPGRGKEVQSEA